MKLYFKYVRLLLKSQTQYKASFALLLFSQFLYPFVSFAGIYLLFERFGNIHGWTMFEVFVSYAVIVMSFAVAECFSRGFDQFSNMIRTGLFDRVLVRPRGTVVQVLGSGFDIKRLSPFLFSVVVLILAIVFGDIQWTFVRAVMLFNMIVGGTVIFSGIYMLQATVSFWTIDGLEFANIFTHGIRQHAIYPLDIFPRGITIFLTFIIPFGTITYFPLQYLLGRIDGMGWLYAFMPLAGALFIVPCILAWRFGVRKYTSAGS
ncbi:MAG: ABC-2 family transporter protein [Defluviitaleaceae bacterium]|nr:ABC-2 family transporter protein [Defluviitaleaceae bacterium]